MTDVVFVKTRHEYESYLDYFKLVTLSNFDTCYVDEVDTTQHKVYILTPMNGEWTPHIDHQDKIHNKLRNCHLIQWNLERPMGSAGGYLHYGARQRELMYQGYFDEVWTSDSELANRTQLRFVVLGSNEGLGEPGDEKRYDFTHQSYMTNRRNAIYNRFNHDKVGPNCWPPERDEVLKASKFGLAVHQDIHFFQEPLRLALFAAYGLPIISEDIYDMSPWTSETMITSSYDNIVQKMRELFDSDYEPYREMGLRARERMCHEFRFKTVVERAVAESVDSWR